MSWREKFTIVPDVYTLLRRDNDVLLIRRYQTGNMDGYYSLPAGHIDGGESAVHAAVREANEEVGVIIKDEDMKFVHVVHRIAEEGDHERVDFFFEALRWENEPINNEPNKCDEIGWFDINDMPEMTAPLVRQVIEYIAAGQSYSDINF